MDTPAIPRRRQWLRHTVGSLAVVVVLAVMVIFIFQDVLLWHPLPYRPGQVEAFPRSLAALDFRTTQGKQTAFYAPARDFRPLPSALWVLFAGNGSLAMDWQGLAEADPDQVALFCLSITRDMGGAMASPRPLPLPKTSPARWTRSGGISASPTEPPWSEPWRPTKRNWRSWGIPWARG